MKDASSFGLGVAVAACLLAFGCGNTNPIAGTGPYGPAQLSFVNSTNPATNPWPQSIAVADFNRDGKLDLVVPTYSISGPYPDANVLLGNGDGTFTPGPAFPVSGQNVNNALIADFNGDGKPDVAISMPDANEIQVLLGNGTAGSLLSCRYRFLQFSWLRPETSIMMAKRTSLR